MYYVDFSSSIISLTKLFLLLNNYNLLPVIIGSLIDCPKGKWNFIYLQFINLHNSTWLINFFWIYSNWLILKNILDHSILNLNLISVLTTYILNNNWIFSFYLFLVFIFLSLFFHNIYKSLKVFINFSIFLNRIF